jgi:hypothetical protein
LVDANVNHSSTTATNRGKLTTSATSTTPGSEVSDPGPALFLKSGPTNLALLECNFPGDAQASDDDTRLDALEAIEMQKRTATFTDASLTDAVAGEAQALNIGAALPAGAVVFGARVTLTTQFTGGSASAVVLDVGWSGATESVMKDFDAFGSTASGAQYSKGASAGTGTPPIPAGGKQLIATFTPDGSHTLAGLTAGSAVVDVFFAVL